VRSKKGVIYDCSRSKAESIRQRPERLQLLAEDDGWNGVYEELSLSVRGSSFEDAKTKMEAELQAYIESILRKHSRKRVA
jgi:hypothetical protein